MSIVFNRPDAKNPIERLLGAQKGKTAPIVDGSARSAPVDKSRTSNCVCPPASLV